MNPLTLLLLTLALAAPVFALLWLLARRIDNYGIVDVAWALAFTPAALFLALVGQGLAGRRLLAAALAVAWSLRLSLHLGRRVLAHLDREDGRYTALRKAWAGRFDPMMFGFFLLQAASVVVLCLPFALASADTAPALRPLELVAAAWVVLALLGEAIADRQLARFRSRPENKGKICASGLWAWSRHPNYFFEALVWLGFALFAAQAPWGWTAFACPALILFLLLKVTGVAATEEHLLRTRGQAYREYVGRTSAFMPLPPRRSPGGAPDNTRAPLSTHPSTPSSHD